MQVAELELTKITSADEAPVVVHGTYRRAWQLIKDQGLSRMKREHIHFASGLPGESGVISGKSVGDLLFDTNLTRKCSVHG